jgi:hypothetical protein
MQVTKKKKDIMQTFSDFIGKRFEYNENNDSNPQVVSQKIAKSAKDLEDIISKILNNTNYHKEFLNLLSDFIESKDDQGLQQMINHFKQNNKIDNFNDDSGLGTLSGVLNRPNNLPPNMGG